MEFFEWQQSEKLTPNNVTNWTELTIIFLPFSPSLKLSTTSFEKNRKKTKKNKNKIKGKPFKLHENKKKEISIINYMHKATFDMVHE